jgi:hypothetical protein
VAWKSHQRRTKPDYQGLIDSIRATVARALPKNSTVAVVSRGDEELLKLEGHRAWHFPRLDDGQYAGHYPTDGAAAVAHLEELRARGCEYFLIPQTSLWWLEHYTALAGHLAAKYSRCDGADTADADAGCVIFDLSERKTDRPNKSEHWQDRHLRELAEAILPEGAMDDYVLAPQRRPLRADQLRGLRLIVRRENVGAIYQRGRHP